MNIFVLIDCNNFFVSCERVFDPTLNNRPVIVLSNNDGCAIARSNEAKKLGIKMGEPFFKIKNLVKRYNVAVRSTNFALYGDMSHRVMETLYQFTDDVEIYSIDEAFLSINNVRISDLSKFGQAIKQTVWRWTGIPVSVGIAKTKTLAKAASELTKHDLRFDGVLNLVDNFQTKKLLEKLPVGDVWGIGRQYQKFLNEHGVYTAYQFICKNDNWIKKNLHSPGLATAQELRGISCIDLEDEAGLKKSIITSRTFGAPITNFDDLNRAVASFVARAAQKLREENAEAKRLTVYIASNRFGPNYYSNSATAEFSAATDYTPKFISTAENLLLKIYKKNIHYKRAGVTIYDIRKKAEHQFDIFENKNQYQKMNAVINCLDAINHRFGYDTIRSAAQLWHGSRFAQQTHRSPEYTTSWSALPRVKL